MKPPLESIIEYASLAPSQHNTQPWKFSISGHYIKLHPDFKRSLPVVDPDHHEMYISLGCVLENFIIAANHFGYDANVMYDLNSEQENILIHLYESKTKKFEPLFLALKKRHVNRKGYNREEIPAKDLGYLIKLSEEKNVSVKIISNPSEIKQITNLVKEACMLQYKNPLFKKELLQWMRFNEKTALQTKDGIRSATIGSPDLSEAIGKLIFSKFTTPENEARKAKRLIEHSSALVLFTARKNNKENWVQLGRSFERFALVATICNISHSHINMPCEEEQVRRQLKKRMHLNEEEPLLLIRIGYAVKETPRSYRRPVKELMMEEQNASATFEAIY